MDKLKLPSAALALVAVAIFCVGAVRQARAQGTTPVLAVAEIHYVDTSGEVIDQSADHRRRLREFEAALRSRSGGERQDGERHACVSAQRLFGGRHR